MYNEHITTPYNHELKSHRAFELIKKIKGSGRGEIELRLFRLATHSQNHLSLSPTESVTPTDIFVQGHGLLYQSVMMQCENQASTGD